MYNDSFIDEVSNLLNAHQKSFSKKLYSEKESDNDILMDVFGISTELRQENLQYWNGQLGRIWESLVCLIFKYYGEYYQPALKIGLDQPCDLINHNDAIDTKYRIGSGDSGTLKKLKQYGKLLISKGYSPVLLILRNDNLHRAIQSCKTGGWTILAGDDAINYIINNTGINPIEVLNIFKDQCIISR